MRRRRHWGVRWIALAALVVLAGIGQVTDAHAGIVARNEPDGHCIVRASVPGVMPWELRLERRRHGRWVTIATPQAWTRTQAIFSCSPVSRATIRAHGRTPQRLQRTTSTIRQPKALTPRLRMVYAYPRDRPPREQYAAAIATAAAQVQQWYGEQLGRSFRLSRRGVERCALRHRAAFYATRSYPRMLTELGRCRSVVIASPGYTWLVYADVEQRCGAPDQLGVGVRGLAIMPHDDLAGLVGELAVDQCGKPLTPTARRWIGGAAHELGHAFGLAHPSACDRGVDSCDANTLMWLGYTRFPQTYLTAADRRTLRHSPFFSEDWRR